MSDAAAAQQHLPACVCVECVRPKAPWRLAMGIPQLQQQQQQVNDSKDYRRFFLCQVCFWAWKPHKSYCFSTSLSFKRAKLHTATPTVAQPYPLPPHCYTPTCLFDRNNNNNNVGKKCFRLWFHFTRPLQVSAPATPPFHSPTAAVARLS